MAGGVGISAKTGLAVLCGWLAAGSACAQVSVPFFDGFESGALSGAWSVASSKTNGRVRVTTNGVPFAGARHVALDASSHGFVLNELVLAADLASRSNVFFDCWARDYSDNLHLMPVQFAGSTNADGIALSVDGTNWHRLAELRSPGAGNYTNVAVDVSAFAAARGLSLAGQVKIKFQQYDDYPMPTDGWTFDNVQLYDRAQAADLVLTLSDAPDPVAVGSNLTYAVAVSNAGLATAENVFLTNRCPAGAVLVSAAASQGTWTTNGTVLAGDLGALASGAAATLTIVVQPQAQGVVTNAATVSTTTFEPQTENNRRSATTLVGLEGGDLYFLPATVAVDEDRTEITLTVVRTGRVVGAVSFDYATEDGTAQAGRDFTARSETLTLGNGVTNVSWTIPILNDEDSEDEESFSVRLFNATGGARLVAPSNATVTIRDEDGRAAMPFEEGFESGVFSNYWSRYTTGIPGPQITTSNSPHAGSRHVSQNGDILSFTLNELILNADLAGQEGVYLRFWHKRFVDEVAQTMSASFKNHAFVDGVAISVDGTNWYKVHGLTDAETGTNEYRQFDVALDPILAAQGLGFTGRVRIKFQSYGYFYPPNSGRFFDDVALYTRHGDLRFAAPEGVGAEDGGAVTVAVERVNGDSGEVSVDYSTFDGTARAGSDYESATGRLVFSNGVRKQSIVVPILQDAEDEPLETFTVQLTNSLGGAGLASPTQAVVTIADDDGPGEAGFQVAQYAEAENNGLAAIAVARRYGKDGVGTVRWRTAAGTATPGLDYVESIGTVVFADGQSEATFEVPLLDDFLQEGSETIRLFLDQPDGEVTLGSLTNAMLSLLDDETPRAAFPCYEGFESGAWSNYWAVQSTGAGRIQLINLTDGFEGSRSLTMDSASGAALNEATLTVDLSGQSSVVFRCWTRDYGDAPHAMPATFIDSTNADGIAVSIDGLTWHRLVDLAALGSRSVYTNLVVDLAAFAAQRGMSLTPTFRVRFQQYDDGPYPARGRSFDHFSLTPLPPATATVIRAQGFEGGTDDTWAFRLVPATGQIAVTPERKYSGTRALKMVTSQVLAADPYIEFENVPIGSYNHVRLGVAFSSQGPDSGDDLYLDVSYDNGATWNGSGSVKLVDGYSNAEIPFGGTNATNPTSVTSNPWIFELPAGRSQIKVRLRFDEATGTSAALDTNFVDQIILDYLPTNQPPALEPLGDRTALVSNRLEFAVIATDIDSNVVTLVASNLPAGASFSPLTGPAPLTNLFEFTPDESQGGQVFPIVFQASDLDGAFSQTVSVRVVDRVVTFSTNRLFVEEGGGGATLGVALSRAADASVPLSIQGNAALGGDYALSSTTLVFAVDGPAVQYVELAPLADEWPEGPENVRISLAGNPETTAGDAGCEVFIRDDDSVTLATANLTSGGTAIYMGAGERILQAVVADVVAIQEFNVADPGGHRAFVDRVFGTNFSYCVEPAGNLPNGLISRWPILAWGEWEDPQVSDREFLWATVDVPGGRPLHVVSVHLHASGGASSREIEARLLTNYIAQAGYHPADYVVLCGDLNTQSRSEAAFLILRTLLSDARVPNSQDGDPDTNQARIKPYDVVLPIPFLDARHLSVNFGGRTFPEGLVFDTRLWSSDDIPYPAQVGDSAALSMQHMAVEKLFALDRFVTLLARASAQGSIAPSQVEVGLGSNQAFALTAAPYHHVGAVTANGAVWTPPTQVSELAWVWSNAQANGWVDVSFAENLAPLGTPEWWLAQQGFTNDFAAAEMDDPDIDGMLTWQEYRAGTRPGDPLSLLQFETIDSPGGAAGTVLRWQSASNRTYAIWRSSDLTGHFTNRVANRLPASYPVNVYTDAVETLRLQFYRIEVEP